MLNPPTVERGVVIFDRSRFDLTTGRFLGFDDRPEPLTATNDAPAVAPDGIKAVVHDVDAVALDPTGRWALVVTGRAAEVRDASTGALRWHVAKLTDRWPHALALAPGGDVAALADTQPRDDGIEQGRLRIFERRGARSSVVYEEPHDTNYALQFHRSEGALTLLVSGMGFTALRRGARTPRPRLHYPVAPPPGFTRVPETSFDTDVPQLWLQHERRGVEVIVTGLEASELSSATSDRQWAALAFRRMRGVEAEALDEPARAFRFWRDGRTRHAELIVPACREGISNTDDYLRVSEVDGGLVVVAIIAQPGTRPREMAKWLATFVDAPLGSPPAARRLPTLPARSCGI
jgi:hypothetical protein